eukprot:TRINITY_DN907_c0_g1_i1.p1 TRINITY_DN907_c0_g1~~TRINITY_DN907_c0_g1_i1.p1  ORF type:complete len:132 (-),score=29.78 TRINITY_DN907_c0_g1_i1:336-731(-)
MKSKMEGKDKKARKDANRRRRREEGIQIEPMALRPRTIPTPMIWPRAPQARVSVPVKPAGSPVWRPESLSCNFSPAVDFLLAEGANPNLPANSMRVVLVTIIRFVGDPMKSQRTLMALLDFLRVADCSILA